MGKFAERILKQLWRHHDVPGDPAGKGLNDLIKGCSPFIRSATVIEALRDIQRLRNRSAHDGYVVAEEDGLTAVRRLVEVLAWFASVGSSVLTGQVPALTPVVAAKAEFLSGLYVTLGFSTAKRFELSEDTVYQLFTRQVGLRSEYAELVLSRDVGEVRRVLATTGGEMLRTRLPKFTRFLVVDDPEQNGLVPQQNSRTAGSCLRPLLMAEQMPGSGYFVIGRCRCLERGRAHLVG
ncbi:hypothetical protein [Nocardia transvalensis]|uniref:hypothetical protein n=1 Tax=Nocardia transvalensis TaxID=37333 RepID=UPI001895E0AF|nr:hypothetical protein [Nocardia transvalensis]MBF6331879.1 hypothetical protein [Nocardia transvalensis]